MSKAINTLSNLVYAVVGVIAFLGGGFTPFVLSCVGLAGGSGAFHFFFNHPNPKVRFWSHHADEMGMYMVFSSIAAMMNGNDQWYVMIPVWIVLHFVALRFNAHQVLAALSLIIAVCMVVAGMFLELLAVLVFFGFAYYVRSTDDKDFEFGHALWHLVTGVMIAMLYWFIK